MTENIITLWKKNWKAIGAFLSTLALMVGCIIGFENRYAKAEEVKDLTQQVTMVNENLNKISSNQTEMINQMKTQQQQTIIAINSLSIELQRQALTTKIQDLTKRKEDLEEQMKKEPNNTSVQIIYQEVCNDLRCNTEQLNVLNTPPVLPAN